MGSGIVNSSASYDLATGFQTASRPLGVATTYTKTAEGNVATATDPGGHVTAFSYSWGVPTQIQTPLLTQTRTVNSDGTPATVTVGSLTTTYVYSAGRLTTIKPPGYASGPSSGWTTYTYRLRWPLADGDAGPLVHDDDGGRLRAAHCDDQRGGPEDEDDVQRKRPGDLSERALHDRQWHPRQHEGLRCPRPGHDGDGA